MSVVCARFPLAGVAPFKPGPAKLLVHKVQMTKVCSALKPMLQVVTATQYEQAFNRISRRTGARGPPPQPDRSQALLVQANVALPDLRFVTWPN